MLHYVLVVPVFLLLVTLLVAAHEYGHYLFAKLCGMDVEEFAIGFGKKPLCTWMRRGETSFTIRPLPLGGFVRIKGMIPEEDGSETLVPNGFYSKSPAKRLAVLFAGPLFSVLAGMIVMVGLLTIVGKQKPNTLPVIGDVVANTPAAQAGLRAGDRVVAMDGKPINSWVQMTNYVRSKAAIPISMEIQRGSNKQTFLIVPEASKDLEPAVVDLQGQPIGPQIHVGHIGAKIAIYTVPVPLPEAVRDASMVPAIMVAGVASMFVHPSEFSKTMGGPITMVAATNEATQSGPYDVISFAALLSISLGILNLLPVPPLDGGQIVVAFAELLRRGKRLSINVQNVVNSIGLALVATLIVAVLWVDAKRFLLPDRAGENPRASSPAQR